MSGFDRTLMTKKAIFLDLDGTVYLGDKLIDGAARLGHRIPGTASGRRADPPLLRAPCGGACGEAAEAPIQAN